MSLKCLGNDKKRHNVGWLRGKRAYIPAITVCNRKLAPVLLAKPSKSFTFLDSTEGVFGSGSAVNNHQLVGLASGGIIVNGKANSPWTITQTSYQSWIMGTGDDMILRDGTYYDKIDALANYDDWDLNWNITEMKVNGEIQEYNSSNTVNNSNLNFRDDGQGLGVSNAVDWLNSIMEDFQLQTRFETVANNLILARYYISENFSITIDETSIYHTYDGYYIIRTNNESIQDSVSIISNFTSWNIL